MRQLRGAELKRFKKTTEKHDKKIILLLENIQYARNVASMFRTADAIKTQKIFLTGISHKPPFGKDLQKVSRSKEKSVQWEYASSTGKVIKKLTHQGYAILGLEITDKSQDYRQFRFPGKTCLVVGNETYGIVKKTLQKLDECVFVPMYGKGASLNVATAAAVCLFKMVE